MDALGAGHDAAVQMIDTSVVRVLGRILPKGDDYFPEEVATVALSLLAGRIKPSDD